MPSIKATFFNKRARQLDMCKRKSIDGDINRATVRMHVHMEGFFENAEYSIFERDLKF
jgi:hypothetical protein